MVNRFKNGLTAEEASLIATGLDRFDSLDEVSRTIQLNEESVRHAEAELADPCSFELFPSMSQDDINTHNEDHKNLAEAKQIKEALLEEVCFAHEYYQGNLNEITVIEIHFPFYDERFNGEFDSERTQITKKSLARWFYNHLPDKANLFDPTESYKTIETGHSIAKMNGKENSNVVGSTTNTQLNCSDQITQTQVWQNLYKLTEKAVEEFPSWKQSQPKPQNIPKSRIDDWLTETLKATKREAETIKKIIIELFNL